ncbi:MAG: hypothetical protein ACFCUO_04595 [Rhodospirillales bacterium]
MIEGYEDLRNELCEILGGKVGEQDIDAAVDAIINKDRTTATPALAELNTLARSSDGKARLRSILSAWIMRERDRKDATSEQQATLAINHLLEALGAERRRQVR